MNSYRAMCREDGITKISRYHTQARMPRLPCMARHSPRLLASLRTLASSRLASLYLALPPLQLTYSLVWAELISKAMVTNSNAASFHREHEPCHSRYNRTPTWVVDRALKQLSPFRHLVTFISTRSDWRPHSHRFPRLSCLRMRYLQAEVMCLGLSPS
jgi:hypothetical protein